MTHSLLAAIGISTIAAAVLALVARRVGQPLILGYIVGGVLLGEHLGLGLVHDEAAIDLIAEIGLILLLFIIGLEIDLKKLVAAGAPVLLTGALQVPLCFALATSMPAMYGASTWTFLAAVHAFDGPATATLGPTTTRAATSRKRRDIRRS